MSGLSAEWPWMMVLLPAPWIAARMRILLPRAVIARPESLSAVTAPRLPAALRAALFRSAGAAETRRHTGWTGPAWSLLVIALAQPTIDGAAEVRRATGRAMMLAVDTSSSMERQDFVLDGRPAERLAVVQRAAGAFLEKRRGDRVGLVLFGRDAFVASPPTFDVAAVARLLDSAGVGMAGRSTAIGDAIGLALRMLDRDPAGDRAIVLLSDGTQNAGSVEPEAAAALAATHGVTVHTIAMAADEESAAGRGLIVNRGADLDEATLEAIATATGGRYFRVRSSAELERVYRLLDRLSAGRSEIPPTIPRRSIQAWFLVALLLLLVATIAFDGRTGRVAR